MSSEQYWRNQVAQTEAEYEQIIQGLRDEVEKQRRRCSELMHEQAMQRATAAVEVRNFCTQYVADAKQQQQQQQRGAAAASTTPMAHSINRAVESVPLPALLAFLHEYSHGLLQLPENRRKRERADVVLNPVHHRLRQRMLARHRLNGREDDVLEEGEGQERSSPTNSPYSPPMGPTSGAPAGPRFLNAAATRAATHADPADVDAGVSLPPTRTTTNTAAVGGGGGNGGSVMAASMFGLPTLPPR